MIQRMRSQSDRPPMPMIMVEARRGENRSGMKQGARAQSTGQRARTGEQRSAVAGRFGVKPERRGLAYPPCLSTVGGAATEGPAKTPQAPGPARLGFAKAGWSSRARQGKTRGEPEPPPPAPKHRRPPHRGAAKTQPAQPAKRASARSGRPQRVRHVFAFQKATTANPFSLSWTPGPLLL